MPGAPAQPGITAKALCSHPQDGLGFQLNCRFSKGHFAAPIDTRPISSLQTGCTAVVYLPLERGGAISVDIGNCHSSCGLREGIASDKMPYARLMM